MATPCQTGCRGETRDETKAANSFKCCSELKFRQRPSSLGFQENFRKRTVMISDEKLAKARFTIAPKYEKTQICGVDRDGEIFPPSIDEPYFYNTLVIHGPISPTVAPYALPVDQPLHEKICAWSKSWLHGGDSGGGLICPEEGNQKLYGILGKGEDKVKLADGAYGLFTDILAYRDWIDHASQEIREALKKPIVDNILSPNPDLGRGPRPISVFPEYPSRVQPQRLPAPPAIPDEDVPPQ